MSQRKGDGEPRNDDDHDDTAQKTGLKKLWSNYTKNLMIKKEFKKISAHLTGMATDFTQTFKPYPVSPDADFKAALKKDAKQIFEGLETIVGLKWGLRHELLWEQGLALIIKAPFALLWNTGKGFNYGFRYGLKNLPIQLGVFVGSVLAGAVGLVRGATQIAAYPLTLVLKIPLRLLLTAIAQRKSAAAARNLPPKKDVNLERQIPDNLTDRQSGPAQPQFDYSQRERFAAPQRLGILQEFFYETSSAQPQILTAQYALSQKQTTFFGQPAVPASLDFATTAEPVSFSRPRLGSGSSEA